MNFSFPSVTIVTNVAHIAALSPFVAFLLIKELISKNGEPFAFALVYLLKHIITFTKK